MDFLKSKKGVTMVALTITVTVLIIITSITLANMKDYLQNQKRNGLYNDISNLKTKIDTYYMEHNEIPVLGKYCTKTELESILIANDAGNIDLDSGDNDNYYVIDLEKLDNVTLNYGKEYSTWTSGTTIQDLYIINEKTHQIYYPKGIKFQDEIYYYYGINKSTVTIPDIESSINIGNINITLNNEEYIVAAEGKRSLTLNLSISSATEDITKYSYKYAINQDKNNEPKTELFKDISINTTEGKGTIETEKLEAGEYFLWIKLDDRIVSEATKCINTESAIIIKQSNIVIEEISKKDGIAELTIKYNPDLFRKISYNIGKDLENIKENIINIPSDTIYEEIIDETTGIKTRIYTLAGVNINNYVYVQGEDIYGNITSSYMFIKEKTITITYKAGIYTVLQLEVPEGTIYKWNTDGNKISDGLKVAASNANNKGYNVSSLGYYQTYPFYGLFYDYKYEKYIDNETVFNNDITVYLPISIYGNYETMNDTEIIGLERKSSYEALGLTPVTDSLIGIYDSTMNWNEPGIGTLLSNYRDDGWHTLDVTYIDTNGNQIITRYFIHNLCLKKDTEILIAENDEEKKKKKRSKKKIQDITYDDDIVVWDFDKGEFTTAKPLWIKKSEIAYSYNLLKFSDGSELCTIDQHRIFNKEAGKFTYPMTEETPIGTTTFNSEGKEVKLISKEVIEENVEHYNIITKYHMNVFANGILTSCRFSNLYKIKGMKYVREERELVAREEYSDIPDEYFYGLRLAEQPRQVNRENDNNHANSIEEHIQNVYIKNSKRN